jgi:hypothetical protein
MLQREFRSGNDGCFDLYSVNPPLVKYSTVAQSRFGLPFEKFFLGLVSFQKQLYNVPRCF